MNEVWVGIRDAWYGYSASPTNPLKLRRRWNLPRKFFGDGFQDLAYPIWNHAESGILATPTLVSAGPGLCGRRLLQDRRWREGRSPST